MCIGEKIKTKTGTKHQYYQCFVPLFWNTLLTLYVVIYVREIANCITFILLCN